MGESCPDVCAVFVCLLCRCEHTSGAGLQQRAKGAHTSWSPGVSQRCAWQAGGWCHGHYSMLGTRAQPTGVLSTSPACRQPRALGLPLQVVKRIWAYIKENSLQVGVVCRSACRGCWWNVAAKLCAQGAGTAGPRRGWRRCHSKAEHFTRSCCEDVRALGCRHWCVTPAPQP